MHEYLILIPGLVSLVVCVVARPRTAFVYVFLPTLLLLPIYPLLHIEGLPDLRFFHAAIIPIVAIWLVKGAPGYRFHFLDFLVAAYIFICLASEFKNADFKSSYNYAGILVLGVFLPYIGARLSTRSIHDARQIIMVLVVLSAFLGVMAVYEARMWRNPMNFWSKLGFITPYTRSMRRFGLKRASLVYDHPIFLGHFFAQILPLGIWLFWTAVGNLRYKAFAFTALIGAGLFAAISRGPWVGAMASFGVLGVTRMKQKAVGLTMLVVMLIFCFLFVLPYFEKYTKVKRQGDQGHATYRRATWLAYFPQMMERPYLGHGRHRVVLAGYKELGYGKIASVDNEFLYLGLYHGVIAVFLFAAAPILASIGLIRIVFREESLEGLLAGALCAALWASLITLATVFRGSQPFHVLYILIGMSTQGLIRFRERSYAARRVNAHEGDG